MPLVSATPPSSGVAVAPLVASSVSSPSATLVSLGRANAAVPAPRDEGSSFLLGFRLSRGARWALLSCVLFAAMNLLARKVSAEQPWMQIAATRMAVGAGIAFLLAWSTGRSLTVRRTDLAWRRSVFGTAAVMAGFYAVSHPDMRLSDAVTLTATGPLFVALLSRPLLGEPVGRATMFALALAGVGIVAVLRPAMDSALFPSLVAASGGLLAGVAMIQLRRMGPGESTQAVVFHFSATGAVALGLLSLFDFRPPTLEQAGWMVAVGVCGGTAQLAMTRAYGLERAARVSALSYLSIFLTQIGAMVAFGESPTVGQALGSALVIVAGVMLAFDRR